MRFFAVGWVAKKKPVQSWQVSSGDRWEKVVARHLVKVKNRKDFRSIGRDAKVALRERAVYLVLHEGMTQAEAA